MSGCVGVCMCVGGVGVCVCGRCVCRDVYVCGGCRCVRVW